MRLNWINQGLIDRSLYQNNAGQSLLGMVTDATGGKSLLAGDGQSDFVPAVF